MKRSNWASQNSLFFQRLIFIKPRSEALGRTKRERDPFIPTVKIMKKWLSSTVSSIKLGDYSELKRLVHIAIFFILVGVLGNIIFSLLTTDRTVVESLREFKPHFLGLALVFAQVPWITNTIRVMIWTRFLGHSFSFIEILKITISTELGSALSPTAIGGGYIKAGMLMQKGLSAGQAASLLTLGSVENGLFFAFALPLSIFLSKCWNMPILQHVLHKLEQNLVTVAGVVLLLFILIKVYRLWRRRRSSEGEKSTFGVRLWAKIEESIRDFANVYKLISKTGKTRFAASMLLTSIQWSCRYSILTAMLLSFGIKVDPILFFLFQWVTFTLMTFIPTPGAAAGAEASFYLVYTTLIPKEMLGLMTAGWRFLTFYFNIILGVVVISAFLFADVRKSN
ncbi:flippase-like domain-containing protein [candidate division KSB1 bacterium]|nr:flippase-like domain-containing protein [candidate division KSB1 bacterium]